jgi:hypothetical protein
VLFPKGHGQVFPEGTAEEIAAKYGVTARQIKNFGLVCFVHLNEDCRQIVVNDFKRYTAKRLKYETSVASSARKRSS